MTAIARLAWTALNCPDPRALATFYSSILSWPIDELYRPPKWPTKERAQA